MATSTTPQPLVEELFFDLPLVEELVPNNLTQELNAAIDKEQMKNEQQGGSKEEGQYMYQLKKDLLLLATLAATVTYAAGLNLPGGSWLEDDAPEGHVAGDSILRETSYKRYIVFYYLNALSFATLLLVSLLVLLVQKQKEGGGQDKILLVVRILMVVDLFCLTGAYAVGGSHDKFTVVCASVQVFSVLAYFVVVFLTYVVRLSLDGCGESSSPPPPLPQLGKHLEILMVLAIFAATITYVAGLNPPGGFWRSTLAGQHTAGDPVLQGPHPHRYKAFFFFNTVAFSASLLAITIIVDYERLSRTARTANVATGFVYGLVTTALLGLGGAYATGSCRDGKHTAYVLGLVIPVLVCISCDLFKRIKYVDRHHWHAQFNF
jgi:hypothetical protein